MSRPYKESLPEIRRGSRRSRVVVSISLEAQIRAHDAGGFSTVVEGRIGDDDVVAWSLRRVQLAQGVTLVGQGVAVEDFELRVLHLVQQQFHAD